jgi:hypothetical protein
MKYFKYWLMALVYGALLPSIVAWFAVFLLKGQPIDGGWKPANLIMGAPSEAWARRR